MEFVIDSTKVAAGMHLRVAVESEREFQGGTRPLTASGGAMMYSNNDCGIVTVGDR